MQDFLLGIAAIVAGLVLCFQGYWALRLVIAVWGAFVGFALGAGLIASITGDGFLASVLGWIVAMFAALVFAAFAYFYYAVAVVVTMASAGFALGAAVMVAINSSWTWIPVLVAIVVGAVVGYFALVVDLPMILLVVIGATAGASAIVTGIMLVVGTVNSSDFDTDSITSRVDHHGWWAVLALVLAIAGAIAQSRAVAMDRSLRQAWSDPTGAKGPVR